jgi:tetratricopeptide (TPR) repeat protein
MSEAHRSDTHADDAGSGSDRDAKIEQLLLLGLDHYFAASYELAINVWTRALFLDRSHARARAYIERARSALAERQRESEELLQTGVAAFHRGEADEARRLLQAAIDGGAPSEEALALLERLNRLETVISPATSNRSGRIRRVRVPRAAGSAGRSLARRVAVAVLALAVLGLGGFATLSWRGASWDSALALARRAGRAISLGPVNPWSTDVPAATGVAPIARDWSLAPPRRGETTLTRAKALVASGHLRDALAALESIRPTDAQKADADRLRADIQRQLLAVTAVLAPAAPDREKGERRVP